MLKHDIPNPKCPAASLFGPLHVLVLIFDQILYTSYIFQQPARDVNPKIIDEILKWFIKYPFGTIDEPNLPEQFKKQQ